MKYKSSYIPPILPLPTGIYTIGLHKEDLYDPYRKEIAYLDGRLIPIQFYFPCETGEHRPSQKSLNHEDQKSSRHWKSWAIANQLRSHRFCPAHINCLQYFWMLFYASGFMPGNQILYGLRNKTIISTVLLSISI